MDQFSEDGLELEKSLAEIMDNAFDAQDAVTIGTLGLTLSGVLGAAAFFVALIGFMTSGNDNELVEAIRLLQHEIDVIKKALTDLNDRVNEFVDEFARESNRQTLRDLEEVYDEFLTSSIELTTHPNDIDRFVAIANKTAVRCDAFLRNDYEFWRWIDIVVDENGVHRPASQRFKNMPTLAVYTMGIMTWLAARELVVKAGQQHRLHDDRARLERHRFATSVRPEFDKYHPDPARSLPRTIPENIKYRIRAFPIASSRQPTNRICQFYYLAVNWMTNKQKRGDPFDLLMPADTVLCTLDPNALGSPNLEIEMEEAAGVDTLYGISQTLDRVIRTGTLAQQYIGVFPTDEIHFPAWIYIIAENADLHWYRNEEASRPQGSTEWVGPKRVGNGWGGFTHVMSGGGPVIYGVRPDGAIIWYCHDGYQSGTLEWRVHREVGTGWNKYKSVFSGGEGVIYAIRPDGDLIWHRHDGWRNGDGANTWVGGHRVGWGWQNFTKVFSGGRGVIYAIRPDGVLMYYKHNGYLSGEFDWIPHREIGTGWGDFREVVAVDDGVLYAFTHDGRVLWYRYSEKKFGIDLGGIADQGPYVMYESQFVWEGPVEIKRRLPAFRGVFATLPAPSAPLH